MQEVEFPQVAGKPFYVLGREVFHPLSRIFEVHLSSPDFGKPLDPLFSWIYYWRVSDNSQISGRRFFFGESKRGIKLAYWSRETPEYFGVCNPSEEAMAVSADGKIARAYSNNIDYEGRLELSTYRLYEKYLKSHRQMKSKTRMIKTTTPGLENLEVFLREFLESNSKQEF